MDNLEFAEDGGGIVGEDHFLEVVDDQLIPPVRPERGLHGAGNGSAGINVAKNGAIFCIVAGQAVSVSLLGALDEVGMWEGLLLVAGFEEPAVGCIRY